jgi:hypothetical protein
MKKDIIVAASHYEQKYFFNAEYSGLPMNIQKELKEKIIKFAEVNKCTVNLGFYPNGEMVLEAFGKEEDIYYDEISVGLKVKEFKKEEDLLLTSIYTWHEIFKTEYGVKLREEVAESDESK